MNSGANKRAVLTFWLMREKMLTIVRMPANGTNPKLLTIPLRREGRR
jgi:hypothetical protein